MRTGHKYSDYKRRYSFICKRNGNDNVSLYSVDMRNRPDKQMVDFMT